MQNRRSFLGDFVPAITGSLAAIAALLFASRSEAAVPQGPVLEDRLLAGLRVKTEADRRFIGRVVDQVERGELPVKLVDSTFFWARKKAARHNRLRNNPMVYFRPGLIARARRLGIVVE